MHLPLPSSLPTSAAILKPLSSSPTTNSCSLRSLAPLLNDLPPVSASPKTAVSLRHQLPPLKCTVAPPRPADRLPPQPLKQLHNNSNPQPRDEDCATSSTNSRLSGSPSSQAEKAYNASSPSAYGSYQPEWTSVSSPVLPPSFPDSTYHAPPPRKKNRPITFSGVDARHQETHASTPRQHQQHHSHHHHYPPSSRLHHHPPPRSDLSPDHDDVPQHQDEDLLHATALSRSMIIDDDRNSSSRQLKNTKRAAQNRAAQRAFRERKDRYVRELEARASQFDEYIVRHGMLEERERMIAAREAEMFYYPRDGDSARYIHHLEQQVEKLRREVSTLRVELNSATRASACHQCLSPGQGECPQSSVPSGSGSELSGRRDSSSSTSSSFVRSETATEPPQNELATI